MKRPQRKWLIRAALMKCCQIKLKMELQKRFFSGENPQVSKFGDRNKTANEPIRKLVSRPAS